MELEQKPEFAKLLTKVMGAYGKPIPEASLLKSWWEFLQPYPLQVVSIAFTQYCDENGEFAPVPAGIAKRCRLLDGRPGAEEAWAIALTSRDEAETVVWTQEMAEAFAICQSVLVTGDEVGARMAFKEAYVRLVAAARAVGMPARWSPSLGWDTRKREAALTQAAAAGLLPAPVVAANCPQLAGPGGSDANARAQVAKIKQMLVDMNAEKQREGDLHFQRERQATQDAKDRANAQVANYKRQDAA